MIDIHCHIIPCIDDGAESLEMTKVMLAAAKKDGINAILASSHYFEGYEEAYRPLFKTVSDMAGDYGISIYPSCEHDLSFLSGNSKVFPACNGIFILVDICSPYIPDYIPDLIFDYELKGNKLIFVHPERLFGIKDLPKLTGLAGQGALFQINAASILGRNGRTARKMSFRMLEDGLVHYVATDAHSPGRRGFYMSEARQYVCGKFGEDVARRLFESNPGRLINGDIPKDIPAVKLSLLQRLSRMITG